MSFDRARELHLSHIRLITNAKNPAANWYKRLGFAIEGREERGKRIVLHFAKDVGPDPA